MANDERELYEFSLHTIRELHTNHELNQRHTMLVFLLAF